MSNTNLQPRNKTFNDTFESSFAEKNIDKFAVDKSLIKGIKQNDVGKIIDQGQVSSGIQNEPAYDQYKQLSGIVIETRKRYDEVKTQLLKTEKGIEKLKAKKELLLEDQNKYQDIIQEHRKLLEQTTKKFDEVSKLLESTTFRRDIYNNMKDVVKHDLLVFKKRYFDKDVKLTRDSTKLRSLRTQHQSKIKLSRRCRQILQSVEKSVQVKQAERAQKIQSFCDVLNKKQTNIQNRQIREREIEEVMVSAMTDKLAHEKEWIKMFHANLLVKGVFKAKMERLMMKYSKVELCFHKMKQATSIKTSNQFIEKFITREQTYGMLLESISEKQRHLEQLKQERDQLEKHYNNLLYKNDEMTEEQKKREPASSSEEEQNNFQLVHQLNEQIVSVSRKKQLMYQWATKFMAAYQGDSNRDKVCRQFSKAKHKQLIMATIKIINNFITNLLSEQNNKQKIEEAFLKNNPKQRVMTEEMLQKNIRIKTISMYENEGPHESIQDKDAIYDDLSEIDYLQYNRRALKKNDILNRKFRIKTKPN